MQKCFRLVGLEREWVGSRCVTKKHILLCPRGDRGTPLSYRERMLFDTKIHRGRDGGVGKRVVTPPVLQ